MTETNEEDVVEVPEIAENKDEEGNDTTDWKAKALEALELAKKNHGVAQRYKTKLAKAKESLEPKPEPKAEPTAPKSGEIGYGEKAFLKSYGIAGADELALVKTWIARTGDELDVVVGDEIFTAKLNQLREARASKEAIPTGTKRAGNTTKGDVDYWLQKPFDEVPDDMKAQVLNTRIKAEKSGKVFSDNPVILG